MIEDPDGAGGARVEPGLFTATHWSVVLRARDDSQTALGSLCQAYRQPLLVWLRCRGFSPADSEDVVQGFLVHLLRRNFLTQVGREKGKFRTFLLKCLKNYLNDQHDKASAAKRGGGQVVESLDEWSAGSDRKEVDPPAPDPTPDLEYDRAWARAVLDSAVSKLEEECERQGHRALCQALEPVMFADETASPYRDISARLGMSETAVKVAAHRIRARLKRLVREEVLQTVANDQDWRQEVRYLIELFGRG